MLSRLSTRLTGAQASGGRAIPRTRVADAPEAEAAKPAKAPRTAKARPWCANCGRDLVIRSRACSKCKARVYGLPAEAIDGRAALIAAIGWLALMEFLMSGGLTGSTGMLLFVYALGASVPLLVALGVALFREQVYGGASLGTGVSVLVASTWLFASLVWLSDPSGDFLAAVVWFFGCLGLFALFCAVLVPSAVRTWKASSWRGLIRIAGYVLPLPIAAVIAFMPGTADSAVRARFELSEGALTQHVEDFRARGGSGDRLVGLYRVESTTFGNGCVMLQTASVWGDAGLAYCERNPNESGLDAAAQTLVWDHVKGRWWTYEEVVVD